MSLLNHYYFFCKAHARFLLGEKEAHAEKKHKGVWPPVCLFPEGTNTNGSCLISFKVGAFAPGKSSNIIVLAVSDVNQFQRASCATCLD